jgi:CBS domain-containing protein
MLVSQIMKSKGGAVRTVKDEERLDSVARVLDEERIGAVVVLDKADAICGVLSERDIIRQIARHGEGALSMPVTAAMTRDVITTVPGERIDACLERMTDRRVRHLPVVENGNLAGIISIGDLVKWKIAETEAEAESLKSYVAG